jgi:hypothetical protein
VKRTVVSEAGPPPGLFASAVVGDNSDQDGGVSGWSSTVSMRVTLANSWIVGNSYLIGYVRVANPDLPVCLRHPFIPGVWARAPAYPDRHGR